MGIDKLYFKIISTRLLHGFVELEFILDELQLFKVRFCRNFHITG